MKINFWKISTLTLLAGSICVFTLSSFRTSPKPTNLIGDDPSIIRDRSQIRELYNNFIDKYPESNFKERSGTINKSTLETLLNNMKNEEDVVVYYYFGRTGDSKNVLMLFNDPRFNNINDVPKFVTVAPFCPPNCTSTQLNDYVTTDK